MLTMIRQKHWERFENITFIIGIGNNLVAVDGGIRHAK